MLNDSFGHFARVASRATGTAIAFLIAIAVVTAWAITGPAFGFSDTWQLVINTGTTIVTFLMVFLIQNTQNRDSQAIHAKLDEILLHIYGARNELMAAEDMSDEKMEELQERFRKLAERGGIGVEERIERERQRRVRGGSASASSPNESASAS